MAHKIVYRFDENQKITWQEVEDGYTLQDREAFDIGNFHKPIWNNGVVEGATTTEIDQFDRAQLQIDIVYETANLLNGAKGIVFGMQGATESEINNHIEKQRLVYDWARGELTNDKLFIDMDAKRAKALEEINTLRAANDQLTMEKYKSNLVDEGERIEAYLLTYEVMVLEALEKTERLINENEISRAKQAMTLIKDVSGDVSQTEAATILTQILEI